MLSQETVNMLVDELSNAVSPHLILAFGSVPQGQTHPASDLDLAFLGEKKTTAYERFMLAQRLASLVGRDVDLVDLAQASTVLQMQIIHKGKVLYSSSERKRNEFAMRVYKAYAMLNEERSEAITCFERGVRGG